MHAPAPACRENGVSMSAFPNGVWERASRRRPDQPEHNPRQPRPAAQRQPAAGHGGGALPPPHQITPPTHPSFTPPVSRAPPTQPRVRFPHPPPPPPPAYPPPTPPHAPVPRPFPSPR